MGTARTGAATAGLLFAVLLGGCSSQGGGGLEVPAGSTTPAGLPAAASSTAAASTPAASEPAASKPAASKPAASKPAADRTVATDETFVMPRVVGMNLQDAQDKLQSLGSYLMDQEDALGEHRIQLIDSNWKVCAQLPSAGRRVPVSEIVQLKTVKLEENCP